MKHLTFAASAVLLAASAPAFADSFTYPTFTNAQNLNFNGAASVSGGDVVLTPNNVDHDEGAVYYAKALSLGPDPSFNTSFQFTIASPSSGPTANGFAFFLATDPSQIGTPANGNGNLGLTPAASLAVEFSDFGHVGNPIVGFNGKKTIYNSNLVAAITGGNTNVLGNSPTSYGSPGNVTSCVGTQTPGNNCMNNGDVWTADISYVAGRLTVTVQDAAGQVFTVINGYLIALSAGNFYAGFSGSTGGSSDSVSILDWNFTDVPEPMAAGLFGVGVAALGFLRSRRRAV